MLFPCHSAGLGVIKTAAQAAARMAGKSETCLQLFLLDKDVYFLFLFLTNFFLQLSEDVFVKLVSCPLFLFHHVLKNMNTGFDLKRESKS